MASLHQDPRGRSPYFYCAFRLPNGKPAFRSTKQTDRKAAWRICIEWEKASEAAGEGSMTEVQARKVLDSILVAAGERKIRTPATQDFFTKWLEGKRISKKAGTWRVYRAGVKRFLESLGSARAQKPLTSLHVSDIEAYRDQRGASGVAAATVKANLKMVRSVLEVARRQGLVLQNVAEAVELPVSKSQEREVFTQAEVRAILDAAPPDWRTAVLLGYYTGARLSDVVALKWDNVDLAEGVLFFLQGKTGKRVEVPIHPDLERHLFSIAGDNPRGSLVGSLAGTALGGATGLSTQFGRLIARAGIDQCRVQVSRKSTFSRKSYHSLRHSFASALAAAGVSPELRMRLTGHRSVDVHQRYTHTELEPLKKAIAALPSLSAVEKR